MQGPIVVGVQWSQSGHAMLRHEVANDEHAGHHRPPNAVGGQNWKCAEPFFGMKLSKVSAVCPQMRDGAASTVILFEFQDAEVQRECGLWKVAEVPELVGLAVRALHLTKCSF